MKRLLLTVLLAVSGGCTVIGTRPPPSDWPHLKVVIHKYEKVGDMVEQCVKHGVSAPGYPLLVQILACANVDFDTMTCDIYFPIGEAQSVMDHELKHCQGWDHAGSTEFKDYWEKWKALHPYGATKGTGGSS